MYEFFKRNNKRLMVVFAIVLMISFLLTSTGRGLNDGQNPVIGRLEGQSVTANEVRPYQIAWSDVRLLRRADPQRAYQMGRRDERGQLDPYFSLAELLFGPAINDVAQLFEDHPDAVFLLTREAEARGLVPNLVTAEELLTSTVYIDPRDGRVMEVSSLPVPQRKQLAGSLARMISVAQSFARGNDLVKVPQSTARNQLATILQEAKFTIIERPLPPTTRPTDAAGVQQQFDRYADVVPGEGTRSNLAAAGYRQPDGVKVQYAVVPLDETRRAVRGGRTEFDWELAARQFYDANPRRFEKRTPASAPTTDTLSLGSVSTTTTRPFRDAKEEAIDAVLTPAVNDRLRAIAGRLNARMAVDYASFRTAVDAKKEPPKTNLGPAYDAPEYLELLAAAVAEEFKVRPRVTTLAAEFQSAAMLSADAVLGTSFENAKSGRLIPAVSTLMSSVHRDTTKTGLPVLEPSATFTDASGDAVVARVLAVRPAGKPASITPQIRKQIERDLQAGEAAAAAVEAAETLTQTDATLAAATTGKTLVTDWTAVGQPPVELGLSGSAGESWDTVVAKLLHEAATRGGIAGKPIRATLVVPSGIGGNASLLNAWDVLRGWSRGTRSPRVFVVELNELRGMWTPGEEANYQQLARRQMVQELLESAGPTGADPLAHAWFDYEAVVARVGFERRTR